MTDVTLHVSFHTYYGASWQVSVQGASLTWLKMKNGSVCEERQLVLQPESIEAFIHDCEKAGVFYWEPHYLHCCMLDGSNWSLELKAGERAARSSGTNGYPAGWPEFCNALHKISGLDINPCKTTT